MNETAGRVECPRQAGDGWLGGYTGQAGANTNNGVDFLGATGTAARVSQPDTARVARRKGHGNRTAYARARQMATPLTCHRQATDAPRCRQGLPPHGAAGLLDLDGGPGLLELGLGLLGVLLGHLLEHGLGGAVDQVLGLFQTEAGQ